MEDKEETKEKDKARKKKKDTIDPLPYCRNAPSAEHARAEHDDEPCDDSRESE
ncbi:MAG: hypothetical protein JRJ29_05280 [Deltaproteobacteria bacterium]|nr:hypothetical protein [Deltaproteobacteria bacterium]